MEERGGQPDGGPFVDIACHAIIASSWLIKKKPTLSVPARTPDADGRDPGSRCQQLKHMFHHASDIRLQVDSNSGRLGGPFIMLPMTTRSDFPWKGSCRVKSS